MTGPGAASASRMRIGGFVLLGVAAIAAVIGLISLAGGSGDPTAAETPPATTAPAEPGPDAPPGVPGDPSLPGATGTQPGLTPGFPDGAGRPGLAPPPGGADQPSGPDAPGTPGAGGSSGGPVAGAPIVPPADRGPAASGAGVAPQATGAPVRVFNNSLIPGLAEQVAAQLRSGGWEVVEVGNYAGGVIPVSTVYFRPGTDEEAVARSIADRFDIRVEPRFAGIQNASPGVVVIATREWQVGTPKG